MDQKIRDGLYKRIHLSGQLECRVVDLVFLLFVLMAATLLRCSLLETVSGDYTYFLKPWYDQIKEIGVWASYGRTIGNYAPLYMYFFALLIYLPMDSLAAVKLLTLIFDYVFAVTMFLFVLRTSCQKGKKTDAFFRATLAFGAALFLPSVLMNGAVWGQCDIIYSAFLLLSFTAYLREKPIRGAVLFGVAFSLKLQAVFFLPVLLILWMLRKTKLWHFLLIPAVYIVSVIPAVIAGRSIGDVLSVYAGQASQYSSQLTLQYPNVYAITGDRFVDFFGTAGVVFTMACLAFVLYIFFRHAGKLRAEPKLLLLTAAFFILLVTYFLPHMHERYGFAADLFILALAFTDKKYIRLLLCTQLLTLLSYQSFLFGVMEIPLPYVAVAYLVLLFFLGRDLYRQITVGSNAENVP